MYPRAASSHLKLLHVLSCQAVRVEQRLGSFALSLPTNHVWRREKVAESLVPVIALLWMKGAECRGVWAVLDVIAALIPAQDLLL